jgi:hypothetical protein
MILLWGRPTEAPLAATAAALMRAGAHVRIFDEALAQHADLRFPADSTTDGELRVHGTTIPLAAVTAAYLRPYGAPSLAGVELSRQEAVERRILTLNASLWAWADITPATVINRPSLMASNGSKPLQAKFLAALGFDVPDTLITNDPIAARNFAAGHDGAIFKSISAIRSIVRRLSPADEPNLQNLAATPVQFQAYIPGTDVRVHIVGDDIFACEIRSAADDYRYAGREGLSSELIPVTLPAAIAQKCHQAAATLGLPFCGIDLRRTPDGRWVAFEVNPSPGFSYFAEQTGAPIADALASLLMK